MKIISWNVNGLRSVVDKGVLLKLIQEHKPDVLLLQEIKCTDVELETALKNPMVNVLGEFPDQYTVETLGNLQYNRGKHGVATLVKNSTMDRLDGQFFNGLDPAVDGIQESRLQVLSIGGMTIINTYSVNVRTGDLHSPNCRVPQRELYDNYLKRLGSDSMRDLGSKLLMIGDFNVVHELIDVYKAFIDIRLAGMTDSERASFNSLLLELGMVDTFRYFHPEEIKYSYWSYRGRGRLYNNGWRLDYALVSADLLPQVTSSDILTDVIGSDHAPILVEIDEVI